MKSNKKGDKKMDEKAMQGLTEEVENTILKAITNGATEEQVSTVLDYINYIYGSKK